jgi:fructose-1,6-bisphosphatase
MTDNELLNAKLLNALKQISERLAKWALNGGCLDYKNISNDEQKQLDQLELILEDAIVSVDGNW